MELDREAVVARRLEQALRPRRGVKPIPSQKASTALASPCSRGGRQDRSRSRARTNSSRRSANSGGSAWSASKVALDPHRLALAERLGGAQHLQLGLDVEPVARLDLDRGDAARHQRPAAAAATPRPAPRALAARVAFTVESDAAAGARRSPHRSRLRAAARTRPRGCRRRPDGCGNRPGPASPRRRAAARPSSPDSRPARSAARPGRSARPGCRSRHSRSRRTAPRTAGSMVAILQSTSRRSHMARLLERASV